ncbi:o-succinylbenzoate--CoA ligase [Corynebacterium caspium]|uniref:o-succinylbenzoate--CoA ligase n=1 Tax=Corynebacterium caspium TaxID=234828 RepID=UPI0003819107|nr:Long-chain-fatty-acid--CoA ligase [Corynebacterium caspium DSM 44850]
MYLELLDINPAHPLEALPALSQALRGERAFLPVPLDDANRRDQLRHSLGVGQPISADTALVVATSGSTGTPKGALLSAQNLEASVTATTLALGSPGAWLLAMPGHYIAGIQVLIRSILTETPVHAMDLSRGFSILEFSQATALLADKAAGMPLYTSLTPMQLMKALDTLDGIETLRKYGAILIGGAPLPAAIRSSAERLGIKLRTTYGASETAGGCIYDGIPLKGVTININDTDSRISISGPMVSSSYRTPLPTLADGWFHTNDAGRFDADGRLQVLGRLDSVIDSGGLKLHPEVLENALVSVPGVHAACVIGIPDPRLGQAIAAAYEGPTLPAEVYPHLAETLPRWQWPRELKQVPQLPRLASGKIDRLAVRRLF